MDKSIGIFWVAKLRQKILIKIEGYATLKNTYLFQDFVFEMVNEGYDCFIIDFSNCCGMDSTFVGTLLGLSKYNICQKCLEVTIINTKTHHKQLFSYLGISSILSINESRLTIPNIPMEKLQDSETCYKERIEVIIDAHQNLVKANQRNEELFEDFLNMVHHELAEHKCLAS